MFFFFSSRSRHTRCSRDWSSDVCSSDLAHFTSAFRRAHWNAGGIPIRSYAVREPSIHALHRLALETRPGLARADPGSLAGRIQAAGVLALQPLDQLGRRVVRGDAVLVSQPLALP